MFSKLYCGNRRQMAISELCWQFFAQILNFARNFSQRLETLDISNKWKKLILCDKNGSIFVFSKFPKKPSRRNRRIETRVRIFSIFLNANQLSFLDLVMIPIRLSFTRKGYFLFAVLACFSSHLAARGNFYGQVCNRISLLENFCICDKRHSDVAKSHGVSFSPQTPLLPQATIVCATD